MSENMKLLLLVSEFKSYVDDPMEDRSEYCQKLLDEVFGCFAALLALLFDLKQMAVNENTDPETIKKKAIGFDLSGRN